ncbi:MAG TPA: DUF2339 domain-containing protein [Bryobacteraceae bacterium]|nr:DUF2339 domain-containing protein [Bryobacteraceae bacterium]
MEALAIALAVAVLVCCIVLPIVAIVRTRRIRQLELRLSGVEAALLRFMEQRAAIPEPATEEQPIPAPPPVEEVTAPEPPPLPLTPPPPLPAAQPLEAVIGQKWVGWIAVVLILFAVAFFLKYAFENRWIGELGRVTMGVLGGLTLAWGGLNRHRKGWRYLSQILTGGGIAVLYLSVYGAFGYYHLIDQRAAFVFLAIIVAEGYLLSLAYNARSIAIMALAGGFLVPILLSTGRDQYRFLFTYITALDLGVLGVVLARRWRWIGSLAYLFTQGMFWAWYSEHYHPEKRVAVLVFQAVVFLMFVATDLAPHVRQEAAGWEEWVRVAVNPFVFYATCYSLLDSDQHLWMGALALVMAVIYAALARAEIALRPSDRRMLLVTLGTALTFVTIAIPVQLDANWITGAWAVEALVLLWASFETASWQLRVLSAIVFLLALARYFVMDTPWSNRPAFTPLFNDYFLITVWLTACLGAAAFVWQRKASLGRAPLILGLAAFVVLWLGSSVEAYTYFDTRAAAATAADTARQLHWAARLSLSVLWSIYGGLLTATGFRLRLRPFRAAGLILFGITLLKVVFVDISELQQLYRIIAFLALGLLLLWVAWAYQRTLRREQGK